MKPIDEIGSKLCKIQAELFSKSTEYLTCSSPVFLRRYMNSDVAKELDDKLYLFDATDHSSLFERIEEQFGKTTYGKIIYSTEELYWMGYIYRYWAYTCNKTSKQLYKFIKPTELRNLYYPYHSLDPAQAIERILESKQVVEEDYTEKGVKILREIIKTKQE